MGRVLGLRQAAILFVFACAIAAGIAPMAALSSEHRETQAERAGIDVSSVIETVRRHRRALSGEPVLSPEYPTSDPVVGAANEEQTDPAVAFDGTNYLVVWRDSFWRSFGIYGTRVSPEGVVLDPDGIEIHAGGVNPAVSFGAKSFLVVWADCDRGGCQNQRLIGARVSPTGAVLDTDPITISTGPAAEGDYTAALAFDGENWLVAWSRRSYLPGDIRGTRVTQDGIVLDTSGIRISTARVRSVAVAFDGTNYLVVWSGLETPVTGARVDRAGRLLDPAGIPISGPARDSRLAFDGTNYLVVWEGAGGVHGARVSPRGQVLDPAGFPISSGFGHPAIAFDGTNYLVVGTNAYDVYGARVTPKGKVLDPAGIRISSSGWSDQDAPVVAFDGVNYLVAWPRVTGDVGDHGPRRDIFGGRVTPAGKVLDATSILLSTEINVQDLPAVAFDGTNYLVAWRDTRPGWEEVYAARVSQAGEVLDPAGIRVAVSRETIIRVPALAFDGTNYLLIWSERDSAYGSEVRGARVSTAGIVLDPDGIEIAQARSIFHLVIDFDGTNYLAVWGEHPGSDCCAVSAARVSTSGQVLDPDGILIAETGTDDRVLSPGVAFGGENYLVTWPDPGGDVYGARVDTAGQVLDPSGFLITSMGSADESAPVAFDGANYVVAWHDVRAEDADVYAARVSQDGLVLDPGGIPISTAPGDQQRPAISVDGANSVLTWEDARSAGSDLFAARLSPAGELLDPGGIPISKAAGDELRPALGRGRLGETAVVYERQGRVLLRFVSEGPVPMPRWTSGARLQVRNL